MRKREKSAVLATAATFYYTFVSCLMPFLIRTFMIQYIGIEYLGIKGLFESILQMLNILNLGTESTFFTYFLYKPCEENDHEKINMLMGFIRRIYISIGIITFALGLLVMFFLPGIVNGGNYPSDINIYFVYLLFIISNSLSYFASYRAVIYPAILKTHVNSLIWGTVFLIMYSFQLVAIIYARDFVLYSSGHILSNLILSAAFTIYNRIKIPWLTYRGKMDGDTLNAFWAKVPGMLISRIRSVSRNSLDCIVISFFLGLTVLARFQNYYQVMLVPMLIVGILSSAIQPALGNGISSESPESNYGILKQFTFVQSFTVTVCTTCLITLIQPFMRLWVGEDNILGMDIVVCIAVYFYVLSISGIGMILRDTTGTWDRGKWISIVETILNIILNVLLIRIMGLSGIIIASILTVAFINIPFEVQYVFKYYFSNGYRNFMHIMIKNALITAIITFLSYFICIRIEITNYYMMFIRCIMAIVLPSIMFFIFHIRDEELRELLRLVIMTFNAVRKMAGHDNYKDGLSENNNR